MFIHLYLDYVKLDSQHRNVRNQASFKTKPNKSQTVKVIEAF